MHLNPGEKTRKVHTAKIRHRVLHCRRVKAFLQIQIAEIQILKIQVLKNFVQIQTVR